MANLPKFEKLAASVTSAILRNSKYKTGVAEWQIKGSVFAIPLELSHMVNDYAKSLVDEKLEAVRKKDPQVVDEYVEYRNFLRVFGSQTQPNFAVRMGALSEMFGAGIHKTTPKIKEEMGTDHDLCLRFGTGYLPIEFDATKKKWIVIGAKEFATIRFDYGTVNTQEGELKILIGVVSIGGSDDIEDRFLAKVGIKRDEKNKKKDAFSASDVQFAFSKNNIPSLIEMLTVPASGSGNWTHTFSEDIFEFGKYPVVSLKKEKRSKDTQTWINYVVNVIDASGTEVSVRLEPKDQVIWNTLSATYPWTDENGVSYNDSLEVDENDFLGSLEGENDKYSIVYHGKTKKSKTYKGVTTEYWETAVNFEVTETQCFQKLSSQEVSQYSGGGAIATPIKTKPITGIDDLLATSESDELADAIPF